jgi:hypothetical protein
VRLVGKTDQRHGDEQLKKETVFRRTLNDDGVADTAPIWAIKRSTE